MKEIPIIFLVNVAYHNKQGDQCFPLRLKRGGLEGADMFNGVSRETALDAAMPVVAVPEGAVPVSPPPAAAVPNVTTSVVTLTAVTVEVLQKSETLSGSPHFMRGKMAPK
jgi:hypothetical protein